MKIKKTSFLVFFYLINDIVLSETKLTEQPLKIINQNSLEMMFVFLVICISSIIISKLLKSNFKKDGTSKNIKIDEIKALGFKERLISIDYYGNKVLIFVSGNESCKIFQITNDDKEKKQ